MIRSKDDSRASDEEIPHTQMLRTTVKKYSAWNIHYIHRGSVGAIHHLNKEPVARFKDGCVNFKGSEGKRSAAKQQPRALLLHFMKTHVDGTKIMDTQTEGSDREVGEMVFLMVLIQFIPHRTRKGISVRWFKMEAVTHLPCSCARSHTDTHTHTLHILYVVWLDLTLVKINCHNLTLFLKIIIPNT